MNRTHDIKIKQCYFDNIVNGKKTFEIRNNDRDYQVGDTVYLHKTDEEVKRSNNIGWYTISYIHQGYGLEKGFAILGISKFVENKDNKRWNF